MTRRLTVVVDGAWPSAPVRETVSLEELRACVRSGRILRHLGRYREVRLCTHRLEALRRPYAAGALLRLLGRGPIVFQDTTGREVMIDRAERRRMRRRVLIDAKARAPLLAEAWAAADALLGSRGPVPPLNIDASPVYLRTDLIFGLVSGGSVGHIAGVLNNLDAFTGPPVWLTTDRVPTVRADIETHLVLPTGRFADFAELPRLAFNGTVSSVGERLLAGRHLAFLYQRYSPESYAGARLAKRRGVPFVLEYNGSEVWIARHWGRPMRYERLAARIELANLHAADLISVVSRAIGEDLVARGVPGEKILVNPNGVDPDRYNPAVDGEEVRRRYHLGTATVIGFIGTFERWHGAELLCEAFGKLLQCHPAYRSNVKLLLVGDGPRLPACRDVLVRMGAIDSAVFAGRTQQHEGALHLAACDVLVSPHVPNADGTPFFGSPTKLFEYMAAGRSIVASDLDQIAEVLNRDTAILVPPGDSGALSQALAALVANPELRGRLGGAARAAVVASHSWRHHTGRIIDALRERCA